AALTEILAASDSYRESHAKIYRAALQLYGKNEPVDAITLTNELEQRGELDEIGGRVRLLELARLVPAKANARHYAGIVRETATLRGLILAGGQIAQLGWDREGEPTELVARAEQLVFELGDRRAGGGPRGSAAASAPTSARGGCRRRPTPATTRRSSARRRRCAASSSRAARSRSSAGTARASRRSSWPVPSSSCSSSASGERR